MSHAYWDLPNSSRCAEHQDHKPYGHIPKLEQELADALLPLIDSYGLSAVKHHAVWELDISETDVI